MLKRVFILSLFLFTVIVPLAKAATFTVDSTLDEEDATPGDGICATTSGTCTLRAAVQEANALSGDDSISLPAGTYNLDCTTEDGCEDDIVGMDVSDNLTVAGAGMTTTIIDGGSDSSTAPAQVFNVECDDSCNLTVSDLKITDAASAFRMVGIGNLDLISVDISGNVWAGDMLSDGNLTLTNSNISNNVGVTPIRYSGSGNVTISGSTFARNSSSCDSGCGGAIYADANTVLIYNSTISGNTVSSSSGRYAGGGIYVAGTGTTLKIYNSTITANSNSSGSGGGLYVASGTAQIKNTIIASNTATSGTDCYGTITSDGYNLISDKNGCTVTATTGDQFGDSSSGTVIDPGLDALASNGGNTQTHALQTTSLAKNAADPAGCTDPDGTVLSYDQRGSGYDRISGSACDIGAYELQVPNMPPISNPGISHKVYTAKPDTTTIRYNLVLDGSHSSDPEGGPLTYSWSVVSVPTGSAVTTASIADPTLASTSATLDHAGNYVFRLVVTDDQGQTNTAILRIRLVVI